jgi:hypothetical protein
MLNYRYRTTTYTVLLALLAVLVAGGVTTYLLLSRPDKEPPEGARLVYRFPGREQAYICLRGWHATGGAA